ncbi:hypothetical protein JAAARDRAFT_31041 [Jaapia argillacea MUCL 33604]|uniref:Velvet domain-containing protein n=1 Tax=Jaapia argillacea MUCL 33604 TaxID=933084 RepID=A0A067Q3E2_9AGAM|nr:hypothetical protein JAAARDRAFT_31041 [Jaapia argillacea MUCL 33604]
MPRTVPNAFPDTDSATLQLTLPLTFVDVVSSQRRRQRKIPSKDRQAGTRGGRFKLGPSSFPSTGPSCHVSSRTTTTLEEFHYQAPSILTSRELPPVHLNGGKCLLNARKRPAPTEEPVHSIPIVEHSTPRSQASATPVPPTPQPSTPLTSSSSRATPQYRGASSSSSSRLSVSSLLCDDPSKSYHLEIVQQPVRAAEFGSRPLSRLPLSPPLVVQLHIKDQAGNPVTESDHEVPFLISHLSLFTTDGSTQIDVAAPPDNRSPPQRLLYGTLVSSAHCLRNLHGRKGVFFLFPDASVRFRGRFQLRIQLMRLSRPDASEIVTPGGRGTILAEARTNVFDVVARSDYVAPTQTPLTQRFLEQGVRMYAFASALTVQPSPR